MVPKQGVWDSPNRSALLYVLQVCAVDLLLILVPALLVTSKIPVLCEATSWGYV